MEDDKLISPPSAALPPVHPENRTDITAMTDRIFLILTPFDFINPVEEDLRYALHGNVGLVTKAVVGPHQLRPFSDRRVRPPDAPPRLFSVRLNPR
jgi:hypothetical protein